jgi:hypothetical protein
MYQNKNLIHEEIKKYSGGIAPLFLTSVLDETALFHRKIARYTHWIGRWVSPRFGPDSGEGNRTRPSSPVARHYTDWTVAVLFRKIIHLYNIYGDRRKHFVQ